MSVLDVIVGASFTAVTVTGRILLVLAVEPLESVDVTEMLSSKSLLLFSGGMMLRFSRSCGKSDHDPSGFSVPADITAPSGTPVIVIAESVSEPSVSTSVGSIFSAI